MSESLTIVSIIPGNEWELQSFLCGDGHCSVGVSESLTIVSINLDYEWEL